MKHTKVLLGFPWYNGPDVDTFTFYFELIHYFGRMFERSLWVEWLDKQVDKYGAECPLPDYALDALPKLNSINPDDRSAEITFNDEVFHFWIAAEPGYSLPGKTREMIVERGLAEGCEWLLMWDDDMTFDLSTFLRLYRHQKPVVAALAFTARDPQQPVIYRMKEKWDEINKIPFYDSETVWDYPKDQLIGDEDVGGVLTFGTGVVLINLNVFKQIPKPWFASTGCGEDFHFCVRCHLHGIPRYVDTSVKTLHKPRKFPEWYGEDRYWRVREQYPEVYKKLMSGELKTA